MNPASGLLPFALVLLVGVQDPVASKPAESREAGKGALPKLSVSLGGKKSKARKIEGGLSQVFHGVTFSIPGNWKAQKGPEGLDVVPPGVVTGEEAVERYIFVSAPEIKDLDSPEVENSVATLAREVCENAERVGDVKTATWGDVTGRFVQFTGKTDEGVTVDVRACAFKGNDSICAFVTLGLAELVKNRENEIAAILASMSPEAAAAEGGPGGKTSDPPATAKSGVKHIKGGSLQRWNGLAFDLPARWKVVTQEGVTALVPDGSNPLGIIEELYLLSQDSEVKALDGPMAEASLAAAVKQFLPDAKLKGDIKKTTFGDLDGRIYLYEAKNLFGQPVELRVHGFLVAAGGTAIVAFGDPGKIAAREADLNAILGSLSLTSETGNTVATGGGQEIAGEWVYMSTSSGGGGSHGSYKTLNLFADGSYRYRSDSDSSGPAGGAAWSRSHSGTWSATGTTLTLRQSSGATITYRLEKRNHPKNTNDPMIILDGVAFVTATARNPWR